MRRHSTAVIGVCLFVLIVSATNAGTLRRASWARVVLTQDLPEDLKSPEGRTEWDFTALATEHPWVRVVSSLEEDPGALTVVDQSLGRERLQIETRRFESTGSRDGAERWLLPERDDSLYVATTPSVIEITAKDGRSASRLRIESRRVGMGWLHLPSGPREVILQRARIFRASGKGWIPDRLLHRWIDPRAGVVAEAEGPASSDGATRVKLDSVSVIEEVKEGQAGLRTYEFMMDPPVFSRLSYGYDRLGVCTEGGNLCSTDDDCTASSSDICTTPVSVLTPDGHATIGELIGAASWDFSANNLALSRFEAAQTISPVDSAETCSWNECGFNIPGVKLGRADKNFDDPANVEITTTVTEKEQRVDGTGQTTDYTIWLRAGVNKEGQSGSLGQGESRICYTEEGRTPVPLWRFANQDATGWYWTVGDSWSSDSNPATPQADPFQCENTIFVHTCPNTCGLFCQNSIQACNDYSGTQGSTVLAEGPVTLPSGHTFNALLVRNVAEFCVYLGTSCALTVSTVRTVNYLWEVPWLGTVVRLTSAQDVADYSSFTEVAETDIKYGLFPPRSIAIGAVTDTSVEITWDPGLETHRVDGFKIYWSTVSGDFSDTNSLVQPAAMGNSAVVSGLTTGTEYFFTVTSMSDYTNPATSVTTTYESLMLPMTAPAVPDPIPMEVAATPGGGCVLGEVSGLTVDKVSGGNIELCWDPGSDACLVGYQILGAQSPESEANFTPVVDDTGLVNCQTVAQDHAFYVVVGRGSDGSTGPWGHFDR